MTKTPPWDLSNPEYCKQKQRMFHYRGLFVHANTPTKGQLFFSSVLSYTYDAADVMNHSNFATMLESFFCYVIKCVAQVTIEKLSRLDHLVFAKMWCNPPKKALNMIFHNTE